MKRILYLFLTLTCLNLTGSYGIAASLMQESTTLQLPSGVTGLSKHSNKKTLLQQLQVVNELEEEESETDFHFSIPIPAVLPFKVLLPLGASSGWDKAYYLSYYRSTIKALLPEAYLLNRTFRL